MSGADDGRRTVRVRIEGRVQGVGFRAWTERTAGGLGLDGWVRNRRDGGVEAVFSGSEELVEEMVARAHKGPPGAAVRFVKVLEESAPPPQGFDVLPTL